MIAPTLDLMDIGGETDEELMRAVRQRDHSALTALYSRHAAKLKGIIYRVLQDEAESDDVLQESLLQIWREAENYSQALGKPLGWIITIARRRAIDRARRRQAYARARDRFELFVAHEPRSWLRDRADVDMCGPDLRQFLQREIKRLPEYQREAIELSFFDGLSHREIAAKTRTPLGTIKTRLELGLRKLTNCVKPHRGKI
ncbi:MAG: sigma-70 family RNA polymerase sigma factor [Verrucomicrobiota bacterium]|nr:sigma-70 family RNA polymerase sigma factor [Verrucomicrobiota bacterium]